MLIYYPSPHIKSVIQNNARIIILITISLVEKHTRNSRFISQKKKRILLVLSDIGPITDCQSLRYCVSMKSCPFSYSNLRNKKRQDFLDILQQDNLDLQKFRVVEVVDILYTKRYVICVPRSIVHCNKSSPYIKMDKTSWRKREISASLTVLDESYFILC